MNTAAKTTARLLFAAPIIGVISFAAYAMAHVVALLG